MNRYSFDEKKHCHVLDGKELIGTTTALSILAKPLTWWASGMAVGEMGWRNPKTTDAEQCESAARESLEKIKKMNIEEFIKLLNIAYSAHNTRKEEASGKGIDLHSAIEVFIKNKMAGEKMSAYPLEIEPFVRWTFENVKHFIFSETHCYSEVLWTGGIADFAYMDKNDKMVLADIKSSKSAYYSMWVQLGGYQLQIEENGCFDSEGNLIYRTRNEFDYHAIFAAGAGLDRPFFNTETQKTRRAFGYCVNLYKEKMFFEGTTGKNKNFKKRG